MSSYYPSPPLFKKFKTQLSSISHGKTAIMMMMMMMMMMTINKNALSLPTKDRNIKGFT